MNALPKIRQWIWARRFWIRGGFVVILLGSLGMIAGANFLCRKAAENKIFKSTDSVPTREVGLVLGTGKLTKSGNPNLHFIQRMETAAELYHAGKVDVLLVSGDNHVVGYDEPTDMREALVSLGVPTDKIICDYAGFRTLDSVVRAKIVFGLERFTIITEEFHCPRAVWIARRHGLDVVVFAAPDLKSHRWTWRVKAREHLARVACALDLYVLNREPKFSGPKEPILLTANDL